MENWQLTTLSLNYPFLKIGVFLILHHNSYFAWSYFSSNVFALETIGVPTAAASSSSIAVACKDRQVVEELHPEMHIAAT